MGKSLTACEFLKAWKASDYRPAASVLICVGRREEIGRYIKQAGLEKNEVAVLTTKDRNDPKAIDWQAMGVAVEEHRSARIMFTTQAMVKKRMRRGAFGTLRAFFYGGRPRDLRIWDETMEPDAPPSFRADLMALQVAQSRHKQPELARALQALVVQSWSASEGALLTIPEELAGIAASSADIPESLAELANLAGEELLLLDGGHGDMTLIGSSGALDHGLAPCVILDASGRVRKTYDLWKQHRGDLERLPAAQNDYRQLELHLWQRGSGKSSMSLAGRQAEIADAVAKVINDDTDDGTEWLIVNYLADEDLFPMIQDRVQRGPAKRLHRLTWGRHQATNDYAHVRNVVVVGQITYRDIDYTALACAASGLPPSELDSVDLQDIRWSEFQHHLLQALCRAHVRKSTNGVAGACRAYVIATPSSQTEARVRATFPGCDLQAWRPVESGPPAKVLAVEDYLLGRLPEGCTDTVTKADVRQHLGIKTAKHFGRDVIDAPHFQAFLKAERINVAHHGFTRQPYIEPLEAGWTLENDPDFNGS